jgi:hypothetical protein
MRMPNRAIITGIANLPGFENVFASEAEISDAFAGAHILVWNMRDVLPLFRDFAAFLRRVIFVGEAIRVHCEGLHCGHSGEVGRDRLALADELPIIHIPHHRRFVCMRCRKVTVRSV